MPAAGILGRKRSKFEKPILHNSKSPEILWRIILEYIKILDEESTRGGPHPVHEGGGAPLPPGRAPLPRGPPGGSLTSIFSYMKSFDEKKMRRNFSGRDSAATRRNLGGSNLELQQSCSTGETSLREGEIVTIVITIDPLSGRGSISINIFTSTISSPNPSSSLVSNSYLKVRDWC